MLHSPDTQNPTVCETIVLRIVDRDVDGDDDLIGTVFLNVSSISYFSQDDLGEKYHRIVTEKSLKSY